MLVDHPRLVNIAGHKCRACIDWVHSKTPYRVTCRRHTSKSMTRSAYLIPRGHNRTHELRHGKNCPPTSVRCEVFKLAVRDLRSCTSCLYCRIRAVRRIRISKGARTEGGADRAPHHSFLYRATHAGRGDRAATNLSPVNPHSERLSVKSISRARATCGISSTDSGCKPTPEQSRYSRRKWQIRYDRRTSAAW